MAYNNHGSDYLDKAEPLGEYNRLFIINYKYYNFAFPDSYLGIKLNFNSK